MCFPSLLPIKNVDKYNWAGDLIVNEPIVLSFRKVPETKKRYKIDVRDFIKSNGNALIGQELKRIRDIADKVRAYRKSRKVNGSSEFFLSKKVDSFDFRANVILASMYERFVYDHKENDDPWLMPDELLSIKKGDCEDFAFLLASLLISSGISSYNVRVVLGKVIIQLDDDSYEDAKGHAWVMYKQENGLWKVLEPTIMSVKVDKKNTNDNPTEPLHKNAASIEYIPEFVFNDDHLWVMTSNQKEVYSQKKIKATIQSDIQKKWNQLDVSFHGQVHKNIITELIDDKDNHFEQFKDLGKGFGRILLFGPVVDRIDNFFSHDYDPIEHFDNGYIKEGWDKVNENINKFKANRNDIFPLCLAVHAVADFYAHSTYPHFALPVNGEIPICDFQNLDQQTREIDYLTDPIFKGKWGVFSQNVSLMGGQNRDALIKTWQGQLISGRYAQKGDDDNQGFIESLVPVPTETFKIATPMDRRAALPHHDEIAVDDKKMDVAHKLYSGIPNGNLSYENQFNTRYNLAKAHIKSMLITLKTP